MTTGDNHKASDSQHRLSDQVSANTADGLTRGAQFGVDARRSVSFLVLHMNPPDIG